MSENKIIIDGIDVSECEHQYYKQCQIDYDEWNNEIVRYNKCEEKPNCNFKRLKRAERKIKELSKVSVGFADKCRKMGLDIFHLKDENNKLKRKEQKLEKIKEISKEYKVEYTVNNGVQLLTNKVIEIIEGKENEK